MGSRDLAKERSHNNVLLSQHMIRNLVTTLSSQIQKLRWEKMKKDLSGWDFLPLSNQSSLLFLQTLSRSIMINGLKAPLEERGPWTADKIISSGAVTLSISSTSPNLPTWRLFWERKEEEELRESLLVWQSLRLILQLHHQLLRLSTPIRRIATRLRQELWWKLRNRQIISQSFNPLLWKI